MNADLSTVSPLAAFVGSFIESSLPAWVLILAAVALHWFLLLMPPVIVLGYLDRKLGADIQMRIGPNRVNVYGIAQGVADTIKAFFKEDNGPNTQEGFLFRWGSVGAIVCVFTAIGSIPMAEQWALSNLDSGVVYVLTALGFSNLCMFWAAYSAHSEWAVLSAFRILAAISAYIVPVALAMLPPILVGGSASFDQIVRAQGGLPWNWIIFHNPGTLFSGAALFLALLIWQARPPFDHFRASGEVAGGLTAEYSGLRNGLLGLLEYVSVLLACSLIVAAYLGGWRTPFDLESFGRAANLVQWLFFTVKVFALALMSIWIRWSLPRLRVDQIVNLSWRVLVPMGLLGAIITAVWMVVFGGKGIGDFI